MDKNDGETVTQPNAQSPVRVEKDNVVNNPSLANRNRGMSAINLFDEKQLAAAENFLTKIMRSEKGGIKNINDGLAVLMRAQDLDLPFSTCLEHIHVINGKTGVDIHIIKALLLKAGCTWRCVKDYQPLYEYTDSINVYVDGSFPDYVVRCNSQQEAEEKAKADVNHDKVYVYPVKWYKDFNGNLYKDYQLNQQRFGIVTNKQQAIELSKNGKVAVYRVPNNPIDFITEYEITRKVGGKEVTAIGKFSYTDAVQADMFTKDTYKKYPRILIGHRAFTYAAREIASDILFGVCETTELKIISGQEVNTNEVISVEDAEIIEV